MPEPVPSATPTSERSAQPAPWWSFGMVWFMLSGPALVVVAGFATLAICIKYPDVELHETPAVVVTRAPAANPPAQSATWQPGEAATISGH
jgi:hypothetical protein